MFEEVFRKLASGETSEQCSLKQSWYVHSSIEIQYLPHKSITILLLFFFFQNSSVLIATNPINIKVTWISTFDFTWVMICTSALIVQNHFECRGNCKNTHLSIMMSKIMKIMRRVHPLNNKLNTFAQQAIICILIISRGNSNKDHAKIIITNHSWIDVRQIFCVAWINVFFSPKNAHKWITFACVVSHSAIFDI